VDLRVGLTRVDVERLPPLRIAGRIGKLRARLSEEQLDCLVVTALANVRYLTGFTGSAAVLVVTSDQAMLATDGRYRTQAAEQLEAGSGTDVELVVGRIDAQRDALAKIVRESAGDDGRVGFEAEHIPWGQQIRWAALFSPSEPVPTNGLVEGLRVVKDDGEIARIAAAAEIADAALAEIVSMIDQARTESEVASPWT
jgi:Xaa-Pro aminopeptidase